MTRVPVDLGAKEQFSEAYARINSRRAVPTLVLKDGTAIGEVFALLWYLEETHPNPPLLGQREGLGDNVGAPDGTEGVCCSDGDRAQQHLRLEGSRDCWPSWL